MKKKVFSLMMTLVLAFMGVARADVVTVGSGTETSSYVPTYSYYNYSLTQQLYTAAELGGAGTIYSVAFYNGGEGKTRTVDLYMVNTTKTVFASNTDWITVTANDLMFSGSVTFTANAWTTITLASPFEFDGTNLAVIIDDNTSSYSSGMTCRVFDGGDNTSLYIYSDYTNYNPLAPSYTGTLLGRKNQVQFDITLTGGDTPGGGDVEYDDQLHVKYTDPVNGEIIDSLNLGTRPINAWMAPFEFVMFSEGPTYTVNVLDFTPSDGIFNMVDVEYPYQVAPSADVDLLMSTNGTQAGVIERQFVAITEGDRAAHIWPVVVEFYEPEVPDVVEKPCVEATTFPFVEVPATAHNTVLHNDYTLPFPEIPEGYDAVYKLVFANDMILNASVTEGENGKVALYLQEGTELPHPMADNNFDGGNGGGGAAGAPFEAQIGEGTTSTFGYFPFYTLYNYSIAENLFLASELEAAGVTTAPMTSLSWYATNAPGYAQQGISIWMANVPDTELTTTSHVVSGMTLVYTGSMTPAIGWNEFVFNEGNFAWDGSSNVLIFCQRNNGEWNSTVYWQSTPSMPFNATSYRYQDSGAYDVTVANTMYTSTTRPNIIMKAEGTHGRDVRDGMAYGPVITDAAVPAGTYYLVASSTDEDFEVTIGAEEMPCPEVDGFAFNPIPADDADEIEPASVTLTWSIPDYATGWRLVFGSTYYPDPNHDQTIIYPEDGGWSTTMANSYTVRNLWNNTNYFWHVEFNNNGACPEGVSSPIWGFTTHLNVPQNLTVEDETVFNDEQIVLSWNPVVDRTYRMYFIYRDGVKIGETQVNNIGATTYTDGPLTYNMEGYNYYVTAIYDEGESAPSNTVNVKVSGYGDVNGHVYEQDGTTGIANATVLMVGEDEFGDPHTYTFTTDGEGYYTGHIYAGSYDGSAACNGYQPIDAPVQGNPIAINYNETTSPIDYILDENFYGPCAVVAEYYPDSLDPNSPYVKVYWGCGLPTGGIVEDFETGDFSKIDWQLDGSYPWTITTNSPYEGTYCMKSGGAGVANVVSNMTVTVNVPADGQMSFYGKISCENNWDYGYFYIDGVQKGSYSGTSSWVERVFDITEGEHTFQWRYTKDGSVNSNDDCFYVDYISFLRQPDAAVAGMTNDVESNEQGYSTDNRALSHYRVYRTNCYNDGPYTEENTVLLATVWVPDTVYIDVEWADLAPGVYKWGVGAVYVGNRGNEVESPIAWTEPINVNPDMANRETITIGDGTSTTYYGPFNSLWGYSFVEQIYTAAEIGVAGPITAIGFNMQSTDPETNQVDIFMKNVSRSSFADNADWEPVSNTDKVFSGTVTFENGWTTITLDTPFQYDGTSNLMIGMHEYTPGYSTRYFYYTTASNALISAHSDTADPDPFNIGAFTGTKYVQSYRPNLQLEINGSGVIPGGGENPYGPGTDPIQEERESVIVWSNCLDKDMYMENVDVTVLLNSADSPEGTVVTLTNLNDVEQGLYPVDPVTLDSSGYYAWDTFRRGNYAVQVELDGYETIYDTVNIWEPVHLRYVMIEILYKVSNIYVSRTGWAMWDGIETPGGDTPGPVGDGDTFSVDFEGGMPAGWNVIDGNNDGITWCLTSAIPTTWTYYASLTLDWYHGGTNAICSGSYINGVGAINPDEYLVSPQVNIANGSQLSFWVAATDASYPADHFGVFISDNGTSDWTSVQEWTLTAKSAAKSGDLRASRDGNGNRLGTWYNYTVDLSAYAGQKYIAFRHFNCYDQYIMVLDDIQLTTGAKSDDRHLEYYKVMCTSIDGVPIFNHNTVHPFCQLSTDEPYNAPLQEGEHYLCKVACMYSSGWSDWSEPVEWVYEPCDHWGPVDEVTVNTASNGNHIEWVFEHGFNPYGSDDPGVIPGDGSTFSEDFDAGMPAGWTTVDADGDGYTWVSSMTPGNYHNAGVDLTGTGHNASAAYVISGSWANGTGTVLYPDNYLVSPQVILTAGSTFSFWACAQDASYPADHFGVFISDNGTSNWTMVQEWTMTAKGTGAMSYGRGGANRAQGNWYNYSVDLSAFAGQKYIAIRHFNCYDQFILNVDDIQLTTGAKSYNAMASGMLNNGTYAFNITDIANYDERVYFLYNLVNDTRFDVINGEANGMFIISATSANLDLEEAINDFVYNNNIQFGLMDKVQAADVANAYKSSLPAGFVNSLMMDMYIQSRENNMCEFADPFCTDNGMYEFPAGVNAGSGETGPDYDCLYTQPNPAWYYMRIGDAGAMDIHMYSTPQVDIDFCCWGPFDDPTSPCPYGLTEDKVVSCSYSTSWTEHCMIPATAQTGEYYILVITNYSNQTCNINFSMVEGNGSTDCGILPPTDIIGFLITQDGEYLAFAGPTEREYTDIDEFGDHTYCVRPIYPGEMTLPDHNYGWSMGCPVCADNNGEITCEAYMPIHGEALNATDQVKIWWGEENPGPGPGGCEGDEFTVNFDNSQMPAGWTTNDADNDGYNWILGSACDGIYLSGGNLAGSGHNSSQDLIVSGSYSNVVGALYPDNWLISPAVTLCEGSTFSFWACGQDASYVAEHFGVFVSEDGSNFTMVQEWTMTAKEGGNGVMSYGRGGNTRAQGSWHQYTVDLSAYAGDGRKVAIRHFSCTDQFILDVDDIQLANGAKNRANIANFKVYRSTDNANYALIGTVPYVDGQTYYEYIDTPASAGTYYYQVTTVYDNECESGAAVAFDNPNNNYVEVGVTGINENDNKVALYPNPTKGNVTIEAEGMSRITVVSVLGQVVYDTELDADTYTLNMSQFNAGMYMVRVYTEEGVVVKRVTVMQ